MVLFWKLFIRTLIKVKSIESLYGLGHLVSTPRHEQDHLPLDHAAQSCTVVSCIVYNKENHANYFEEGLCSCQGSTGYTDQNKNQIIFDENLQTELLKAENMDSFSTKTKPLNVRYH